VSSVIRKGLPGYRASFERKKQYVQSRLQIAPVGLASRWKAVGGVGGALTHRTYPMPFDPVFTPMG